MHKAILFLGIGLLSGFAVSAWWMRTSDERPSDIDAQEIDRVPDADRIAALERAFAVQIETLEREVAALRNDFALLSTETGVSSATFSATRADTVPGETESAVGDIIARGRRRLRTYTPEGRIEALTEAGFSLDRAQEIERRVEEHRVEAMQVRYDRARRGELAALDDPSVEQLFDTDAMLRSELGDADYSRYLEAMGRPTTVNVIDVLASSAAEQAGMMSGDQIVVDDGQRVFDVQELILLPLEGEPGELVIVDVLRDDQPIQLVLPRGPLGINAPTGFRQPFLPLEED